MQFFAQKRKSGIYVKGAGLPTLLHLLCNFRKCKTFHHGSRTTHFKADHSEVGCIRTRPQVPVKNH